MAIGVAFGVVAALGAAGKLASGLMSSNSRQAEFAEMLRGLQMKKDYTVGLAKARAAASGIEMESASTIDYLTRLTGEFDRQAGLIRKAMRSTKRADLLTNLSGLAGDVAGIVGTLTSVNPSGKAPNAGSAFSPGGSHEGWT